MITSIQSTRNSYLVECKRGRVYGGLVFSFGVLVGVIDFQEKTLRYHLQVETKTTKIHLSKFSKPLGLAGVEVGKKEVQSAAEELLQAYANSSDVL